MENSQKLKTQQSGSVSYIRAHDFVFAMTLLFVEKICVTRDGLMIKLA